MDSLVFNIPPPVQTSNDYNKPYLSDIMNSKGQFRFISYSYHYSFYSPIFLCRITIIKTLA